jgi:hypothetical protein
MELIICGVATIKGRENSLKETVTSIINQVDKLIVYQNGYKEIFDFLNNDKIEVYSSLETGIDMGDAGKFYTLSKCENSYYLSIDDDLIYPEDYVKNLITNLKKYDNKVIVSHHGRILTSDAKSYYKDAVVKYKCLDDVIAYDFVHFGGTGVMAFHTNLVKLKFEHFKTPNTADIWVGLFAQENNIPILVLPHNSGWIKYSDKFNTNNTIYNTYMNNSSIQDNLIINFNKSKVLKYGDSNSYKITFLIPTYNRYDKLSNLLTQINNETTANSIIYNDASTDDKYLNIENEFTNIKVIHGSQNNGKLNYQKTILTLFNEAKKSDSDYFILIADDFILCKSFEEHLKPFLNEHYITNIFSLRPEGWGKPGWVDGAFSASINGLNLIENIIPKTLKDVEGRSTGVWKRITDYFSTTNKSKYKLITLNYSLTQHDGNDDSKLHPIHRLKTPITAENFYNYHYGNKITIIGESNFIDKGKKKSSEDTSNGNKSKNNIKDKVSEPFIPPVQKTPTLNSPIEFDKSKLDNIKKGLETPKQSRITKINDDVFMAKSRKRNLKLGGR